MCDDLGWHGRGLKITREHMTSYAPPAWEEVDEGFWWVVQFRTGNSCVPLLQYRTWEDAFDGAQRYLAMEA